MPINTDTTPATDSMLTHATVKPRPTTLTLKIFKVLVLLTFSELLTLRVFKIAAQNKTEAKKLAAKMVRRLNSDQIEAMSTDAREPDEGIKAVELVDVYPMGFDIPGAAWTRAAIESDDLAGLAEKAAAKTSADSGIMRRFDNMTPDEHAAMKRKLVRLAEVGAETPDADTLEGYALAQYSAKTPKRGVVTKLL